jgi:hypothetical protein
MVQFTGEAYTAGVEEVERDGVKLRIYSVAKTVADCFKHQQDRPGRGAGGPEGRPHPPQGVGG